MEENKESIIIGNPTVISYESTKKIVKQMKKNVCKIKIGKKQGTGFFCKIPFPDKNNMLSVLITNNHIISNKTLNKIISIYTEKTNIRKINLKNRMNYTNEEYDITIIEIKEEDEIKSYLELDDDIINDIIAKKNKNDKYSEQTVYIMQYPEGKLSVSYGIIDSIYEDKKYNFNHKCTTKIGSSGSPILKIDNNRIIGIHKEGNINNGYNRGTFLNYPIKEFIEKYFKDVKEEEEITEYSDYHDIKINKFKQINNLISHNFYFNQPINLVINQNKRDSNSIKHQLLSNEKALDNKLKSHNIHNRYLSWYNNTFNNNIFEHKNKDNEKFLQPYIKKRTTRMTYNNLNNLNTSTPNLNKTMTFFIKNKIFEKKNVSNQKYNNIKKQLNFG